MTKTENAQVGMFKRVKIIFVKFLTLFSPVKPLNEEMDNFNTLEDKIEGYIQEQSDGTGSTTATKAEKKATAIKLVMQLVQKSRPWAKKTKNNDLISLLNVSDSSFSGEEIPVAAALQKIATGIKDHVAELAEYNVTDNDVKAALDAVTAFENTIGTPQNQKETSVLAGQNLSAAIKAIIAILDDCDDLIEGNFAQTNPNEVAEYHAARVIGKSTSRHTTLLAHVYEDAAKAKPIFNAIATITELKRHDDTDIDGLAEIVKFKPGTYHLVITAKGFTDKTILFTIKSGQHLNLDVVMGD